VLSSSYPTHLRPLSQPWWQPWDTPWLVLAQQSARLLLGTPARPGIVPRGIPCLAPAMRSETPPALLALGRGPGHDPSDLLLAAVQSRSSCVDEMRQRRTQIHHKIRHLVDLRNAAQRDRTRVELVASPLKLHIPGHGLDEPGPALGAHRGRIDPAQKLILFLPYWPASAESSSAQRRWLRLGNLPVGGLDASFRSN